MSDRTTEDIIDVLKETGKDADTLAEHVDAVHDEAWGEWYDTEFQIALAILVDRYDDPTPEDLHVHERRP